MQCTRLISHPGRWWSGSISRGNVLLHMCSRQAYSPPQSQPKPSDHVVSHQHIICTLGSMRRTVVSSCQSQGSIQADADTAAATAEDEPEHDVDISEAVVTSWPTFSKDKPLEAGLYVVATPIGNLVGAHLHLLLLNTRIS